MDFWYDINETLENSLSLTKHVKLVTCGSLKSFFYLIHDNTSRKM